jgi:hypothetical protein
MFFRGTLTWLHLICERSLSTFLNRKIKEFLTFSLDFWSIWACVRHSWVIISQLNTDIFIEFTQIDWHTDDLYVRYISRRMSISFDLYYVISWNIRRFLDKIGRCPTKSWYLREVKNTMRKVYTLPPWGVEREHGRWTCASPGLRPRFATYYWSLADLCINQSDHIRCTLHAGAILCSR